MVFLTGQDDIDAVVQMLNEEVQNRGKNSSGRSNIVFLHGFIALYLSIYHLSVTFTKIVTKDWKSLVRLFVWSNYRL